MLLAFHSTEPCLLTVVLGRGSFEKICFSLPSCCCFCPSLGVSLQSPRRWSSMTDHSLLSSLEPTAYLRKGAAQERSILCAFGAKCKLLWLTFTKGKLGSLQTKKHARMQATKQQAPEESTKPPDKPCFPMLLVHSGKGSESTCLIKVVMVRAGLPCLFSQVFI